MVRPLLVLISGVPGSGKTTLARRLSESLQLPVLSKDTVKEALAESLGAQSFAESQRIGQATMRLLYVLIREFISSGHGVIAESNFYRGMAETELHPLTTIAFTVLIHCHTERALSIVRYKERLRAGSRHWSHFDAQRIARLDSGGSQEGWELAEPLNLNVPTLLVDTANGYVPALEDIIVFVRQARG